ncbi:2Fe-2S iron-sulfur cluster-binding protein [Undibacterium sp. Ji83W]|uniref:2Fe-2S iron-sulfur cluster-binding protein n=1 Tax=Undibacterium sp. Ji83W TaxID=3413043 RepID=UPI003BF2B8DF
MSKQDVLGNNAWKLTLQAQGWTCAVIDELSLLEAALLEGIRIPNSCRNGTCRTCMCKMLAGEIKYQIDWPGLSLEEKQEGWILPCVAQACSDVVLDVPAAVNVLEKT